MFTLLRLCLDRCTSASVCQEVQKICRNQDTVTCLELIHWFRELWVVAQRPSDVKENTNVAANMKVSQIEDRFSFVNEISSCTRSSDGKKEGIRTSICP